MLLQYCKILSPPTISKASLSPTAKIILLEIQSRSRFISENYSRHGVEKESKL
jgi:hypothetical protein